MCSVVKNSFLSLVVNIHKNLFFGMFRFEEFGCEEAIASKILKNRMLTPSYQYDASNIRES